MSAYTALEGSTISVNVLTDSAVPDGLVSLSLYLGEEVVNGELLPTERRMSSCESFIPCASSHSTHVHT